MLRPVYLDHAATTPVDSRVAAAMAQCLTVEGEFGNPASASHSFGDAAGARVETARAQVAAAVGAAPSEVIWTSGATEADNLAIFGVAHYYREHGRHIVTARTEHKAVLGPCRELERRGWRVTYLAPDSGGVVHPEQVAAALQADTVLVSIMQVNNEIGVIQDVPAIAAVCAKHGAARLHVDAAQSVGKIAVDFAGLGVDLMSLSAHKVYGPKGVGALLVSGRGGRGGDRERVQLTALQFGGGQERGFRAGTVATHQVVGMGLAFELARTAPASEAERIAALRERLWRWSPGRYRDCEGSAAREIQRTDPALLRDRSGCGGPHRSRCLPRRRRQARAGDLGPIRPASQRRDHPSGAVSGFRLPAYDRGVGMGCRARSGAPRVRRRAA